MSRGCSPTVLVALLLTMAACTDASPGASSQPTAGAGEVANTARPSTPTGGADEQVRSDGRQGDEKEEKRVASGGNDTGGASGDRTRDRSRSTHASSGRSARAPGTLLVASQGTYEYDQAGHEEFCSSATCNREELPATQRMVVRYDSKDRDEMVLTVEATVSPRTTTRTLYRVTRQSAEITRLEVDVDYNGFRYTQRYDPQPAIRALVGPLRVGRSWSGRWTADVSGRYSVRVVARESVEVGGTQRRAFKLRTNAVFTGDLEGRSAASIWIDPSNWMILRSVGFTHTSSTLGTYDVRAAVELRSGPGY